MQKKFKATVEFVFEAVDIDDANCKTITMYNGDIYNSHGDINFDISFGKSEESGGCIWDVFTGISADMIKIEEV